MNVSNDRVAIPSLSRATINELLSPPRMPASCNDAKGTMPVGNEINSSTNSDWHERTAYLFACVRTYVHNYDKLSVARKDYIDFAPKRFIRTSRGSISRKDDR